MRKRDNPAMHRAIWFNWVLTQVKWANTTYGQHCRWPTLPMANTTKSLTLPEGQHYLRPTLQSVRPKWDFSIGILALNGILDMAHQVEAFDFCCGALISFFLVPDFLVNILSLLFFGA